MPYSNDWRSSRLLEIQAAEGLAEGLADCPTLVTSCLSRSIDARVAWRKNGAKKKILEEVHYMAIT